jgi:ribosomal protein S4E
MPRGPKKHLKRLNAPHAWMLGKMDGIWAPRPSTGPHKLRECLPLVLILRNRLKYALTMAEVNAICMQKLVKVDGKVRTDTNYPAGFMDVVTMERSNDMFRLLYDVKGRFVLHRIKEDETNYKLCRVQKLEYSKKAIPFIVTHDGRTIRYPDPLVKVNDTVKVDLKTGKMVDHLKFGTGQMCMIQRGHNAGRVGVIQHVEKHPGSFDIVQVKDAAGNVFATRLKNVFVIGQESKPWVSIPSGKGIKLSIHEERALRKL